MTQEVYTPVEELTFHQGIDELEQIVKMLESNTLELEESLKVYERGVALVVALRGRLSQSEQRIDVLMGELSGDEDDAIRDTTLS